MSTLQSLAQKLQDTHCHVCILDRVSVRSWRTPTDVGSSGSLIDPQRWLSLAALVLRGAAVNEYREPVLNIFGQFSAAMDAIVSCQGVSGLLCAYCRLCHVTMMHREGSTIVSKLLDQNRQCYLLQAGQDAWQDALEVCVSTTETATLSSSNNMHSTSLVQPTGTKKRTTWRPYAVAAWERCFMCLTLAHSYITLSNMAVASRGGQTTSSGPRLRREPSFAQLPGPDEDPSSSQVRITPQHRFLLLYMNRSNCICSKPWTILKSLACAGGNGNKHKVRMSCSGYVQTGSIACGCAGVTRAASQSATQPC